MASRTIASPGVQINELDLSVISRPIGTTDIFMTGFADQGPTEELINISSISEYEQIFGTPKNAAERYLYHSAKEVLLSSPANLLVTRMPYGSGAGEGYANTYSALVYPISSNNPEYQNSTEFSLGQPFSMLLNDEQYNDITQNNIVWNKYASQDSLNNGISAFNNIGNAGLVIINASKTTIDNTFQGFYVSLTDNSEINPSTDYKAVNAVKTINSTPLGGSVVQSFVDVPSSRLNFSLTQSYSSFGSTSISKIIENYPTGYNFDTDSFDDSLVLMVFKLRTSQYNQDTVTLDYVVSEGFTGSLYSNRTQNNPYGGPANTFYLDSVVNNKSTNIKVFTNPYISSTGTWTNNDGTPAKKIRVSQAAKNLYGSGVYVSDTDNNAKDVGNIPLKLQRVLKRFENDETVNLDLSVEAGLGTIWASAKVRAEDPNITDTATVYDESYNVALGALKNTNGDAPTDLAYSSYFDVVNQFVTLADKTRRDHMFIVDPLRHIFIQGENGKISKENNYVFSNDVYWPLKNLFSGIQSSYVATYGNWIRTTDNTFNRPEWVPSSGFAAAIYASTAQQNFPWTAPAGFNRASLTNVLDIAVNPTQKQRDLLYKININPIAFFQNDGYVIYGQKTLFRKPSALDRINVRRLFLTLEKETQALLKYFVFEPNTFATRNRLKGALLPIFEKAKLNDGLYDYQLVCDERNNTPDVVDNNELKISIYIKPVRTAEFILADFVATRTGIEFTELVS